jgi:SAM-dependent methyltransferase
VNEGCCTKRAVASPHPTRRRGARPPGLSRSVAWPLPPPGRPQHAWVLNSRLRRWLLRRLLRRAVPWLGAPRTVLDLGAGTAADLAELHRLAPSLAGAEAVLVEAQPEMLRRQVRLPAGIARPRPLVADAAELPLRDASFDLVLSIGFLCCVAEDRIQDAVSETSRVLAPGGVLVLGVPRWRGAVDEASTRASGLERLEGGRPGQAIFRKPLNGPAPSGSLPVAIGH